MFGVECSCDDYGVLCAVCRISEYVELAKVCGWDFDEGYLFSDMTLKRENGIAFIVRLPKKLETWKVAADLSQILKKQVCMQRKLPSLSGQEGQSLKCRKGSIFLR